MNLDASSEMVTITKMEAQKRRPTRVSIYLDGAFALGMDLALAQELSLRPGQRLSRKELERIVRAEEKNQAKNFALDFLGYRARSVWEVRERLIKRGHLGEVVEEVIEELRRSGLLDDEDFAVRWAQGRMTTKPLGERLLRQELRRKGVPDEVVEKTIAETYAPGSQLKLAVDLLRSRANRYQGLEPIKAKRRMAHFLLRRGFDQDVIWEAVSLLMNPGENSGDDGAVAQGGRES